MSLSLKANADGVSGAIQINGTDAVAIGTTGITSGLPNRNKVINGNFDVWQRGTTQTASTYGSDDRWYNANTGSTKVASQQTFILGQTDVPGNPRYYSRTVVTSVVGAANVCLKRQKVEGVETLSGQNCTISFWAKADATKNIAVEFVQNYGTGGSPSGSVGAIGSQLVALTTSWAKHEITVAIPSISGKTLGTTGDDNLELSLYFDAGSTYDARTASLGQQSGTFDIAQVQLEAGSVATEFEQRSYGTELALCQRYYQVLATGRKSCVVYTANGDCRGLSYEFPKMRSIPAVIASTASFNAVWHGVSATAVNKTATVGTWLVNETSVYCPVFSSPMDSTIVACGSVVSGGATALIIFYLDAEL